MEPMSFTVKSHETFRRIWHSSIGLPILLLYFLAPTSGAILRIIIPICLTYGILDWKRLRNHAWNEAFCTCFPQRFILRPAEKQRMTSSFWFLLAWVISFVIFSKPIATLAMLYLAWCDPIAAYIGQVYCNTPSVTPKAKSNKKNKGETTWIGSEKTLAGSLGALFSGIGISFAFLGMTTNAAHVDSFLIYSAKFILTCILGGCFAALSEAIKVLDLDDNLVIPIISGLGLSLFSPITSLYAFDI